MFDSPTWLGSFITSRTNKEINELNRKHEVMMEDIKHRHEALIQQSRNTSAEDIARANRESNEEIERLKRLHESELASARNKNAISVALIQAASNATGKALPYVLPAFLAGRASNSNHDSKPNNKSNPGAQVVKTSVTSTDISDAKKRADDLFPELEPTFGVSLMNGGELLNNNLPKFNVTQLVPAIGAVLSVAGPILAVL